MSVTRRGRPPMREDHIESLAGGEEEKRRLRVILQTLAGEITIREAGEELGLSDRRVHQIRRRALEGALASLEARPAGRPPRERDGAFDPEEVERLESELEATRFALELTELRHDLDRGLGEIDGLEKRGSSPGPNRAERRRRAHERRRRGR